MPAKSVCSEPGCPVLVDRAGRCPEHRRVLEQARGTRQQRGYDARHDRLRARWLRRVATGTVLCWRCLAPIGPTEPWHLGHDDHDRTRHRGPEHVLCNLSAAGRAAHGPGVRPE